MLTGCAQEGGPSSFRSPMAIFFPDGILGRRWLVQGSTRDAEGRIHPA